MQLSGRGLTCRRGHRTVFSGLDFSLVAGGLLAVTGRNGAGKSTLLRLIAGLLRPAAGTLVLTGGDDERSLAEQAHYLGHEDALKPALTVAENLQFWTAYLGGTGTAATALAKTGLEALADLPAAYLSAGQKRRLSLARLLTVARPIWLLDEPTAALDSHAQSLLTSMMGDHLREGGMIVAATHGSLGIEGAQALQLGVAA